MVSTVFPPRNLFTRPLRGKSNLQLELHIKAPRQSKLVIHHDVGEVRVVNVLGDLEITNHVGEIVVRLAPHDEYTIDAKSRLGDVSSDFTGSSHRPLLLGEKFDHNGHPPAHRIYLRVGLGDITIQKLEDKLGGEPFPFPL